MALPTSYTENGLAEFMHGQAGDTADLLGWTVAGQSYDEIVNDTLLAYGVDTIEEATDMRKLRALAKLRLWTAVQSAALPEINHAADGASFDREAIFTHATALLNQARVDALPYDDAFGGYAVDSYSVDRNDPYRSQVI